MRQTATQFAAEILGLRAPTEPTDQTSCWLCAGDLEGQGVPVKDVIGAAFTDHPKRHQSTHVCLGCAATVKCSEFQRVVIERDMGLKIWNQAGFNSYSHYIAEPDVYECPKPARMREVLLDPPKGRWMMAINESGKKHTIAKGAVNQGREAFVVVCEDETLWVDRALLVDCLDAFERMSELGFTTDEIRSGRLQPKNVQKAGKPGLEAEQSLRFWRLSEPHLLALVYHVARCRGFFLEEQKEVQS